MYVSGLKSNLEKRVHQLMISGADIALYSLDGNGYAYSGYSDIQ